MAHRTYENYQKLNVLADVFLTELMNSPKDDMEVLERALRLDVEAFIYPCYRQLLVKKMIGLVKAALLRTQ